MKKTGLMRSITLLLGILLAIVVFAQVFQVAVTGDSSKQATAIDHSDAGENENQTVITLPSFSIPTPVSVKIGLESYLLFEIIIGSENKEHPAPSAPPSIAKLFCTLFTVIISPNAP